MPSEDAMWHINRKRAMLKADPKAKALEGPYYPSFPLVLLLDGVQFALWYFVQHHVESYLLMGLLAWFNACTIFYSLSTFIHENSHGLILGRIQGYDTRLFCACLIELAFCSFGEQWEYTIVHNHLHHPHLNDDEKDSECPDEGHVAVQPKDWKKWVVPWVELLPLGTLLTRGQLSNNAKHNEHQMEFPQNVLRLVTACVFIVLGVYLAWYKAMLFCVWTTSLYASRWNIALHGQSIAEHYRIGLGPDAGETDPTNSTYFLAENILGFNTGYHDEHHTFPKVAWARLPELKRRFPDEFGKHVNPRRYLDLWFDWAIHGFETGYFRMCKK